MGRFILQVLFIHVSVGDQTQHPDLQLSGVRQFLDLVFSVRFTRAGAGPPRQDTSYLVPNLNLRLGDLEPEVGIPA